MAASTLSGATIFLSYARLNREFANRLVDDLARRGITLWIDTSKLEPGNADWEQAIREAIRDSQALIFVASPDSRRSRYVKGELSIAEMYSRRIFPVWMAGDDLRE